MRVAPCELPAGALLRRYSDGSYTDCFATDIPTAVSQAQYVAAFYTTAVFKLERVILKLASMPSTDAEARQLADGSRDAFAAWRVEDRTDHQLLMSAGRTRSWLMTAPQAGGGTRLYFGSAVVPVKSATGAKPAMGMSYRLLLGFHKIYSMVLLQSAKSRLGK